MRHISIPNNLKAINRLHRRLRVHSDFSGFIYWNHNGDCAGFKVTERNNQRITFVIY